MKCSITIKTLVISLMTICTVRNATALHVVSTTTGPTLLQFQLLSRTCTTNHHRDRNPVLFMGGPVDGETEVEKLLRMARELRAQAEQVEEETKVQLAGKKADQHTRLDGLCRHLFYDGSKSGDVLPARINELSIVVERLKSKNPSMVTMEQFVDHLDNRRDVALGNNHVERQTDGTYAHVADAKNEDEANRLNLLMGFFMDALEVIDKEQLKADGHLGGGRTADDLKKRLKAKRRERDEQFVKRQESFREAARIKKGSKYKYIDSEKDVYDQKSKK